MKIDFNKIIQNSIVLIHGNELLLRRKALEGVISAVGVDEFDLEHTIADRATPNDWLGSVMTAPFLSDRRVLVVRNVLRVDPEELNLELLKSVESTGLLILVADDESSDSARFATNLNLWLQIVKKAKGSAINCTIEDAKQTADHVRTFCAHHGKKIAPATVSLLLETCGNNYSNTLDELEKLMLFVGTDEVVTNRHIETCVTPSREWNVFKMVDAMSSGNVAAMLKQYETVRGSSTKSIEAANRNILSMISRQLKLLWQARWILDSKQAKENDLRPLFPANPNFYEQKDWLQKKYQDMASKLRMSTINKCITELATCDGRLKGFHGSSSDEESVELMLINCCRYIRGEA